MITHIDGLTGSVTIRELNQKELEQRQKDVETKALEDAQIQAATAAKESAKAKLAALGLTEAEVNAIIGGV